MGINESVIIPIRTKLKEFWKRNQIVFMHLPFLLAALVGTYVVLKAMDPRIGVEGFGDLFGYLLNAIRASMIIFTAWWMKNWLLFDLYDSTELDLFQKALTGNGDALKLRWQDRAEWVGCLAFATYWFTR